MYWQKGNPPVNVLLLAAWKSMDGWSYGVVRFSSQDQQWKDKNGQPYMSPACWARIAAPEESWTQ